MVRHLSVDKVTAAKLAVLEAKAFLDRQVRATADDMTAFADQKGAAIFADDAAESGYLLLRIVVDEAEVLDLGVAPAARRQGLGRALLDAAHHHVARAGAAKMFPEVAEDNRPAQGLYASLGYIETGRRAGYYLRPDGRRVDALTLARQLAGPSPSDGEGSSPSSDQGSVA